MFLPRSIPVLLSLVLAVAAHALSLGPERPAAELVPQPAPFVRSDAAVASNGRDFLVVWNDKRGGVDTGWSRITAARVDAEGRVLDATGIVLGLGTGAPAVASDGRDYVVAYECPNGAVCLARVGAANGEVRAGGVIQSALMPAIASDGRGYVLAYTKPEFATRYLETIAVDREAAIAGSAFRVEASAYPSAIASNGNNYLLIWNSYSFLGGAVVDDSGKPGLARQIGRQNASWGPGQFSWSIASDGNGYLVAWQQNVGVANQRYVTELRASAVSATGDAGPERILFDDHSKSTWDPSVAWTGSDFTVTYAATSTLSGAPGMPRGTDGDIHTMVVTRDAQVRSSTAVSAREGREGFPTTVTGGGSTLLVWEHEQPAGGGIQIHGRFLERSEPFLISRSATWQESVTATTIGARPIVAWEEISGEEQRRKVFVEGVPVDETSADETKPVLGGSVIAWIRQERGNSGAGLVLAKRIDANGTLIDAQPFVLGEAARGTRVAVAAIDTLHLIAWQTPSNDIVGARIDQRGGLLDAKPIEIAATSTAERDPVIATDGASFTVAWHRDLPGGVCLITCYIPSSIHAVRVLPFGLVVQPATTLSAEAAKLKSVVWNGSEYVAFWSPDRVPRPFVAQRFGRNLELIGTPHGLSIDGELIAVTWNGSKYLFAGTWFQSTRLTVGTLDRDFTIRERAIVTMAWKSASPVALLPSLIAYQRTAADGVSRAESRPISDEPGGRRRAVVR